MSTDPTATAHEPAFGTFGELPNWVYDVVTAIDRYEYEHPGTLIRGNEKVGFVHVDHRPGNPEFGGWDWCIKPIQDLIPREVHEVAEHIRKYKAQGG